MQFDSPTAEEYPFIYDSWARSFKKSPWAGCIPNHLYDMVSRAAASDILNRGARVVLAVTPIEGAEGRRIMGYSVSEPGVLHWLFVKKDYRGANVGGLLLEYTTDDWDREPWKYTFRTRASEPFLRAYTTQQHRWTWDPVFARVKAA